MGEREQPQREATLADLTAARLELLDALAGLSEADLDTSVKAGPPEFKTWGSIFALIPSHEAHHGGQISVIWRRLGNKPKI